MLNQYLLSLVTCIVITSCKSENNIIECGTPIIDKKNVEVTVVASYYLNHDKYITNDTIIKAQIVDLTSSKIDINFCTKQFKFPAYFPRNGVYRDTSELKEYDQEVYPKMAKWYKYDNQNRVIKMNVAGSGIQQIYSFKYEYESERIIEISDGGEIYEIGYSDSGNITKIETKVPQNGPIIFIMCFVPISTNNSK